LCIARAQKLIRLGGYCSHNIDFKDHLSCGLSSLRSSEKIWESPFFVRSGFYTICISAVKMHAMFREIGFTFDYEVGSRLQLPSSRSSLHVDLVGFRNYQLKIGTSHALMHS
jgi:hypothetical protein